MTAIIIYLCLFCLWLAVALLILLWKFETLRAKHNALVMHTQRLTNAHNGFVEDLVTGRLQVFLEADPNKPHPKQEGDWWKNGDQPPWEQEA